ncbi:MAG: FG-GAP-like repeat-containing protein [bacterium]
MQNLFKYVSIVFFVLFIFRQVFAQQIFVDSGQRLGNAASWDVKLGDLDGDGDLDAVLGNNFWNNVIPQQNEIWLNDGSGTFSKSPQELGSSAKITLDDIDNDGDLDIFENGDWQTGLIKTWLNNGSGQFTLSNKFPFKGTYIIFDNKFGDQSLNDVITFESGDSTILRIYSILVDTSIIKTTFTLNNFGATAMATNDLNKDGYSDIVIGQGGPTYILFNDKTGSFNISEQKLGNNICFNLFTGDLNNDGYPDLLQCNYHNENSVVQPAQFYLNDGTGKFVSAALPYQTSYLTQTATLVDLDNDGDLDIYMNHGHRYSYWDRRSEILYNDGQAHFISTSVNMNLIQSDAIDFGDLDKDGDLDAFLAVTRIVDDNHYGGPSRVWLNTTINVGVKDKTNNINNDYLLFQNYPNPFNPSTNIQYSLSKPSQVKLSIYNMLGQKIKTLDNAFQNVGEYSLTWNSTDDENNPVSSGVYLYRLETDNTNLQKKMVLVR